MNVEEITFGVEIETTIPRGALNVGPHGHGYDIPAMPGWKADADPSIRTTLRSQEGCEFVSPVFKGSEGLKQCLADLAKIKALGAKVNNSCGLHIHVGFDKNDADALATLLHIVANFEKAIYATTGTKAREQGRWCGSVRRHANAENALQRGRGDRYHVLNIATHGKPTVEFRAFGATLDATKLAMYVAMCVGIVERALKAQRKADWTPKVPAETSPLHRSGVGQTELTRLFYQLGWTKGRTSHVHGDLKGEGIPDLKARKQEAMRLARKYDNPETASTRRDGLAVGMNVRISDSPGSPLNGLLFVVVSLPVRRMPVVRCESSGVYQGRNYRVAARRLSPVTNATN